MAYSDVLLDKLMRCTWEGKTLSEMLSDESIENLARNKSTDVRIEAARALADNAFNRVTVDTLCRLAKDEDPLVRLEAVDSLAVFSCRESFEMMQSALLDPDWLVRAYAAYGVAVIGKSIKPDHAKKILLHAEAKEAEPRTRAGIYEGLYILGQENALEKLMGLFSLDDYRLQCAVLNALDEVLNDQNQSTILEFLGSISLSAHSAAVLDTLDRVQKRCGERIARSQA